ncbi:MAG: coiled coil domain-containing protein [Deltaproteobacteria bacterium]|nr:coiled coil domain-containing protein [Deltaproteobacteria bacterium]
MAAAVGRKRQTAASEKRLEKMEAQLGRWSARIDRLVAVAESAGARATIVEHQRNDELRACRAIAQARFDEYRTSPVELRKGLRSGVEQAWNDLAAVMRSVRG